MTNKYEPEYRYIDEIYLKEIIFEKRAESTDVTIFGYLKSLNYKKWIIKFQFSSTIQN